MDPAVAIDRDTDWRNPVIGRLDRLGDPFEGRGARRRALRLRIEGIVALTLSIVACGLTAAMWLQALPPVARLLGRG